ncbi:MAG: pantetheine-phosphate adenylyltransferase [Chitinophagales bacterium]
MMKKAVFPGSFDPLTIGHYDILMRALPLFDEVVVAIGENSQKKYSFPLKKRVALIEKAFANSEHSGRLKVQTYSSLTVKFCDRIGAKYIIRGVRTAIDFDYEKNIAQMNTTLYPDVETLLFIAQPQYSHISSTLVREVLKHGGDVSPFLPPSMLPL